MRATLLLPENMALEHEEDAIKYVDPRDIPPQAEAEVTWLVRPLAVGANVDRTFEVLLTSENGDPRSCTHAVTLEAALRTVGLDIPDDLVGSYGQKVTVPILLGETLGRDVFSYKLTIRTTEPDPLLDAHVNT